jgi:DNA-binding CsgD family transcriptional regulator
VRDLIIAEAQGNPLALIELPRGLTSAELAGGFGLPGAAPLTGRIEQSFRRQLEALPAQTRRLLLLAAADPSGSTSLVWRAAARLGIPVQAAAPAVDAELVEAAVRSGDTAAVSDALTRLTDIARDCGTDLGLGIEARSRALLSDGETADGLYREAISRLSRTRVRPESARAHLLYAEWLRREANRADARTELRTAYQEFASMGTEAFAERARRELLATGETVHKRTAATRTQLTAQEASIARLARDGQTNTEIGAQLFLSARTVEWHLCNVCAKLGISSRRELRSALMHPER